MPDQMPPLIQARKAIKQRKKADLDLILAIRQARREGYTYRDLRRALGLSLGWLHKLAQR